jgi:hypothetical protein
MLLFEALAFGDRLGASICSAYSCDPMKISNSYILQVHGFIDQYNKPMMYGDFVLREAGVDLSGSQGWVTAEASHIRYAKP